jgi:hypothetical protein
MERFTDAVHVVRKPLNVRDFDRTIQRSEDLDENTP